VKVPVIVDAARTPMGRSKGGIFRNVRSETLCVRVIDGLLKRNKVDPEDIDEVIFGCANQMGEQGYNIARLAMLLTDIPNSSTGKTINMLCGSSLEAINTAARQIMVGDGKAFICGGIEHMGHIPMDKEYNENPAFALTSARASQLMGVTAEYLAITHDLDRESQDQFSYRSHKLAHEANWESEILPTLSHNKDGALVYSTKDEPIRPDTNMESLGRLRPAFNPEGTVTAGNSSSISDGAAGVLVLEEEFAISCGYDSYVRIENFARAGISPSVMGLGPVPTIEKLTERTGVSIGDVDVIELNEAFAAQSIAVLMNLDLLDEYEEKVNLKGGAIALGHPLGCSGARITVTLFHLMKEKKCELGVSTMCIGLGQGIATLFKNI